MASYARSGGGGVGTSETPAAMSEEWGPSQATSGNSSARLSSIEIKVGTAASQLWDWPWQARARKPMTKLDSSLFATSTFRDEQQERSLDDLQQLELAFF